MFQMPALAGSWSDASTGSPPIHKRIRPITFDHDVAGARRRGARPPESPARADEPAPPACRGVGARDDVKKLNRVTVRMLPDAKLDAPAALVVSRLVITGGNHHRLHEELTEAGGYLRDAAFKREERVLASCATGSTRRRRGPSTTLFDALRTRFKSTPRPSWAPWRSKDRPEGPRRHDRSPQAHGDRREMAPRRPRQEPRGRAAQGERSSSLFSEDERTQVRRDRLALEARLAAASPRSANASASPSRSATRARRPHVPRLGDPPGPRVPGDAEPC